MRFASADGPDTCITSEQIAAFCAVTRECHPIHSDHRYMPGHSRWPLLKAALMQPFFQYTLWDSRARYRNAPPTCFLCKGSSFESWSESRRYGERQRNRRDTRSKNFIEASRRQAAGSEG